MKMADNAIVVENISKKYHLGLIGGGTLMETLGNRISRKERRNRTEEKEFWALKDISFNVKKGEVVGVIGKNGAGKSTLLKVISRITQPTGGQIKLNGRVASLLEVGTGFHPELTGRENIFLNGSILGMTRKEIKVKFDEIVDFSGVEKFIDTPVKRYSSGMYVRLAFAVAAHLEPEILIIDEVLAVGDLAFQKKCLGKMDKVAKSGKTVLFVSHNMDSVKALCNRGILLNQGMCTYMGTAQETVDRYQNFKEKKIKYNHQWNKEEGPGNDRARFLEYSIINPKDGSTKFHTHDSIRFIFKFWLGFDTKNRLDLSIHLFNKENRLITILGSGLHQEDSNIKMYKKGYYTFWIEAQSFPLNSGIYSATIRIIENQANHALLRVDEMLCFEILPKTTSGVFSNLPVDTIIKTKIGKS